MYVLQVVVLRWTNIELSNAKKTTEISNRFRQDLQEVVVDTSERLSDLISKGVELVDVFGGFLSVQNGWEKRLPLKGLK